jgi:hypothetical protein
MTTADDATPSKRRDLAAASEPAEGAGRSQAADPNTRQASVAAAATRALTEAAARRAAKAATDASRPPEKDGRGGLDPVRYGDWEIRGLVSDF